MFLTIPQPALFVLNKLEKAGFPAYLVGGCVRDEVLGIPPHDYDITTSALPDEIKRVFAKQPLILAGEKHGTVAVILRKNTIVEVTAFRVDGDYADGRHPNEVMFTRDLHADLSRRDFTINAMAWRVQEGLVDPFGGQADCKNGLIRCVGEPEKRLTEDALRILRALRFAARLGFAVEPETASALHKLRDRLSLVSRERVSAEIRGLLMGQFAAPILRAYGDVLRAAMPELSQNTPTERALSALERLETRTERLLFAALLMDETPVTAEAALRGLRCPKALVKEVMLLLTHFAPQIQPSDVRPLLHALDTKLFDDLVTLCAADGQNVKPLRTEKERVLSGKLCWTLKQMHLRAADLTALGYSGAAIGQELERLLTLVMTDELPNEKKMLKKQAKMDLSE